MKIAKFSLRNPGVSPAGVTLEIPEKLKCIVLFEADPSDPLNRRRVVGFKVGDLAFRLETETVDHPADREAFHDFWLAAVLIGMEHGAEIRDALKE